MYGLRHSLQFNRKTTDNDAIFRDNAVALNGRVHITKITWWMPKVTPSQVDGFRLGRLLEDKTEIEAGFRMRHCAKVQIPAATTYTWSLGVKTERPRFIVIAYHTGKDDNQTTNPAAIDHCQVTSMKILLNSTEYPAIDVNSNFARHEYAGWYKRMTDFKRAFSMELID